MSGPRDTPGICRRGLMGAVGVAVAAAAAPRGMAAAAPVSGHRRLGTLEVSSIGLGVQNMHRTYQTTIPDRSEMIRIIRAAYDRGVTLFDTAEEKVPFRP